MDVKISIEQAKSRCKREIIESRKLLTECRQLIARLDDYKIPLFYCLRKTFGRTCAMVLWRFMWKEMISLFEMYLDMAYYSLEIALDRWNDFRNLEYKYNHNKLSDNEMVRLMQYF